MASTFTDYYQLLGVSKTATLDDIKRAYRQLARQHHPDLHPEKEKDLHTRRMQEANEAYTDLSSPENRAKYDQFGEHWKEGPPPPPPGSQEPRRAPSGAGGPVDPEGFSDFFRNMFRQGGQNEAPAREFYPSDLDVEAILEISLEDSVRGMEKSFTLMTTGLCGTCRGTGRSGKTLCPVCGGVGEIRKPRDIKTRIPAGLLEGSRIRLKGQGNEGSNRHGDLYLTIRLLPDPRFSVSGQTLENVTRVLPWQAALGAEVSVTTLEGPLRIRIPKDTHTGKRLRLAGKGLGKPNERGDLFTRIEIDIPDTVTPKMEALFKQMQEDAHD